MDLLLRGRGAAIGVRAPLWLVRICGAVLAFAAVTLADELGAWDLVGGHLLTIRALAMAVGAFLAPSAYGVALWFVTGSLVVVYIAVAYTPIARGLALPFIRHDAAGGAVDAVIVLSGSTNEEGRVNHQALDRLLTAFAEARQRGVNTLALSVVTYRVRGRTVTSEPDQKALTTLFAPELNVRFVSDVHSTRDEALLFAALARTHQWKRILVVTSPLHTRRACRTLEVAGLNVECVPAVPREYSLTELVASRERVDVFADVLYESLATLLYRVRGWI